MPKIITKEVMKTTALIERSKTGAFCIFTPDIENVIIGQGRTTSEAKADFENSVQEMKQSYLDDKGTLPDELIDVEFVYKYDLGSFFDYYSFINITQFAKKVGINPSLMRHYKAGQYISEKQMSKIETGLHKIANELSAVRLV